MTQLKELRAKAREQGFRGYSTMRKGDLELLLEGKPIPRRLRKNQVSVGVQTEFPICHECGLQRYMTHLAFKANAEERRIAHVDDMKINIETGAVINYEVNRERYR